MIGYNEDPILCLDYTKLHMDNAFAPLDSRELLPFSPPPPAPLLPHRFVPFLDGLSVFCTTLGLALFV